MDPPAVPPPSPEKSPPPPPQNPHTNSDAITGASAVDCNRKGEPSTCRNMDNFRALVLKFAGRLLPAQQSLIEGRLDEFFPDELLVPDHPPYADMILTALWELNREGGSSEEAISNFIKKEYHKLPWAHATILNHHLRDLCIKGEIVMTHDRCYLRRSSTAEPVPSPGSRHNLCLNISPYSSPCSSPSASLCSSPSSSSSSLCWGPRPPYRKDKRPLKRKRKKIRGRGRKAVRVGGRGRPPGSRDRLPRVRRPGRGRGVIQVSRQGRSSIGEKSQGKEEQVDDLNKLEGPKQVSEDHNEFLCIEDGSKGQYRPRKQYNVMWVGRGEHKKEMGECVKERQSRKQNVSKEQHEEVNKTRKCNVVWIGRRVRKLKEDDASEEVESDADVDTDLEGLNRKEENGTSDDIIEKQIVSKEVLMSVENDRIQLEKQEVEMGDEQDTVMMKCEALVIVESAQKQHDEQNSLEEQPEVGNKEEFKPCGQEKVGNTEQEKEGNTEQEKEGNTEQDKGHSEQDTEGNSEQDKEGNAEQEMVEKQVEMVDEPLKSEEIQKERDGEERDSVMIQVGVESVEKTEPEEQNEFLTEEKVEAKEELNEPHDDVTEELAHRPEQCIGGAQEEFHSCAQDRLKNGEIELAEEGIQQEEQQTEINQKESVQPQDMEQVQLEGEVEVTEEENQQEQLNKVREKDIILTNGVSDVEKDSKIMQNEAQVEGNNEEHNRGLQEESELMNNVSEASQDLMMVEDEALVEGRSMEHSEKQEEQKDENDAGLEKNQSEECKNGVTVQEGIKEQNQLPIQQIELSEKDPLQAKNNFPSEKDHKNRSLRQGLRSSCKKEEPTPKAENQLEQVMPVRRSLRPRKTISETAATTEGLDRSKEQLKHSGRASTRSSKRKPKNVEAEQVSKSQKTGRTDL